MENENKNLNEALSIANEVLDMCKNIRSIILEKTWLNKNYKDIAGIYYKGSFKKKFIWN